MPSNAGCSPSLTKETGYQRVLELQGHIGRADVSMGIRAKGYGDSGHQVIHVWGSEATAYMHPAILGDTRLPPRNVRTPPQSAEHGTAPIFFCLWKHCQDFT